MGEREVPRGGRAAAARTGSIYIWVRQTVDWQDEEAFLAQLEPLRRAGGRLARYAASVEIWNETFNMPFHLFRHRVREIAELNLSRVRAAARADWQEIPHGALVIPIDDDDWLAPDAAEVLAGERDVGAMGFRWIASWIEVPMSIGHRAYLLRRRLLPWTPEKWLCSSNNYAIVKDERTKPLLASHVRASRWMETAEPGSVRRLDRRLSMINRTLASQTTLGWPRRSLTRPKLVRKFHRYRLLYERPAAPESSWSQPYVAMMSELMGGLGLRGS